MTPFYKELLRIKNNMKFKGLSYSKNIYDIGIELRYKKNTNHKELMFEVDGT